MSVSTLNPSATTSNSGVTVTGAGSAHAALNDSSDSSYLEDIDSADSIVLAFDDLTLPAGAIILRAYLTLRVAAALGSGTLRSVFGATNDTTVTAATPTDVQLATGLTSDALIDAAALTLSGPSAGSHPEKLRVYKASVAVTYVTKPVTAPSAPTGTITATNLPTVEWANTLDTDGGAQTQYELRLFTSAQYGAGGFNPASSGALYESGAFGAGMSHAITTPLADGAYRAYVRVGQTVNGATHWSDYAYTAFTVDVDLPATPDTPTLTVQTGRIKVHVEGNTGTATTTHLEVQRSEDGGTTYEPLRLTTDTDGLITGTSSDEYDYEAPNGTLMTYRVRALHEISAGNYVASDWATATATWTDTAWWLKCPEQPSLNMVVIPASLPGYQRPGRQGVFQALGSTETVIVADKRGAPRGTLRLQIDTPAEQDDLDALLDSNLTLLLQGPPAHHWPDRYVRFGDQDRQRWIDKAWIGEHLDTLQWWQVARPTGVVDSWPA